MKLHAVIIASLALLTSSAQAQSWTIDAATFQGDPGTYTELGVGAPAVVWTPGSGEYTMFFETQVGLADAACPTGYWAVGAATSPDGLNWTQWDAPLLEPEPGTYFSCGGRQPTALRTAGGISMWFVGYQTADACAIDTPSWGCTRNTGIGQAMLSPMEFDDGAGGTIVEHILITGTEPAFAGSGYAEPSVIVVGNELHLFAGYLGSIHHATSTDMMTWTWDANPVVSPGSDSWNQHQIYSPTVNCRSLINVGSGTSSGVGVTPTASTTYEMFYGGKTYVPGSVDGGWQHIDASNTTAQWRFPAAPVMQFTGDGNWKSFDVLRSGSAHLMWFEEDGMAGPEIKFASDSSSFDPWATRNRICR